jgi:hypothetical protein
VSNSERLATGNARPSAGTAIAPYRAGGELDMPLVLIAVLVVLALGAIPA